MSVVALVILLSGCVELSMTGFASYPLLPPNFSAGDLAVTPQAFSPNADTVLDTTLITFNSSEDVNYTILLTDGSNVRTVTGALDEADQLNFTWDGKSADDLVTFGVTEVTVTITDSNNTQANSTTYTAYIDTAAPTLSDVAVGNNSNVSSSVPSASLHINFTAADSTTGNPNGVVNYTFNFSTCGENCSRTVQTTTGTKTIYWDGNFTNGTAMPAGEYEANLTLTDWAGNPSNTELFNLTVDNSAPSITSALTSSEGNITGMLTTNYTVLNFTVDSSGSYLLNITNATDATGVLALTGTQTAATPETVNWGGTYSNGTAVTDGSYNVTLTATDDAGNSVTGANVTVDVDNTPPVINGTLTVTLQNVSGSILESEANISFSAWDPVGNMTYELVVTDSLGTTLVLNYTNYTNNTFVNHTWNGTKFDGSLMSEGNATVIVNVTDFLGNNATNTSWIMIDNLAPQAINFTCSDYFISPINSTGVQDTTTFTFHVDEDATYVLGLRDENTYTRTFTSSASTGSATTILWNGNSTDNATTFGAEVVVVLTLTDEMGNQEDYYLRIDGREQNVTIDDVLPTLTSAVSVSPTTFVNALNPSTITATASEYMDNWTVNIYNSSGGLTRSISATAGSSLSTTWNGTESDYTTPVSDGNYSVNVTGEDRAGNPLEPVAGNNITIDNAGVIILSALTATPQYISPQNSTGVQDNTTLAFTPNVAGTYSLNISNTTHYLLFNGTTSAGIEVSNTWNGTNGTTYMTNSTATLVVIDSGSNNATDTLTVYVDDELPSIPVGTNATARTDGSIKVNWTESADNVGISLYRVYRSTTDDFTASASNNIANATVAEYNDTAVIEGIKYYYLVSALDLAGNPSNASNEANETASAASAFTFNNDLAVSPVYISPNADGIQDTAAISFNVTRDADYIVTITNTTLTRVMTGSCTGNVSKSITWDGKTASGTIILGNSTVALTATDSLGNQISGTQRTILVDITDPQITKGITNNMTDGARLSGYVSGQYASISDIVFTPNEDLQYYNVSLENVSGALTYTRVFTGTATQAVNETVEWNGRDQFNNPFPDGANVTVDMYLTDMAGNTLHDTTMNVIIDNVAPTVGNLSISPAALSGFLPAASTNGSTNITFDFTENGTFNILITDGTLNATLTGNAGADLSGASVDSEVERDIALGDTASVIIILADVGTVLENQNEALAAVNSTEFSTLYQYSTANALAGEISREGMHKLRESGAVSAIAYDRPIYASRSVSVPLTNADDAWLRQSGGINSTGVDQNICIIDSGVDYTHDDFGNCTQAEFLAGTCAKVIGGYDYVNDDTDPVDDYNHGTHVAGIAAGNGTVKGVAPGAKIIAVKVLDNVGSGSFADAIAGVDWCTNNQSLYNISVISMSFGEVGEPEYTDGTCPTYMDSSLSSAKTANITLVASSGNDDKTAGINYPACSPYVIPVGASTDADAMAEFSNRGPNLDVLAPGVNINSTVLSDAYSEFNGTSMAAPHVSGAVAVIQQDYLLRNSTILTPAQIETLLVNNGTTIYDSNSTRNYTRLDVMSILNNISGSGAPAGSGSGSSGLQNCTYSGSSVTCTWDGTDDNGAIMTNGTWAASLVFYDYARSFTTDSTTVTLDSTPPVFTSDLAATDYNISAVVSDSDTNLTFTVNEGGTYLINITDGTSARTFNGTTTAGVQVLHTWDGTANDNSTALAEDNYTIVARAYDPYGNEGNSSIVVEVDSSAATNVTLSASDYYISPHTSPGSEDATNITFTSTKSGSYVLTILDLSTPANTRTYTGSATAATPVTLEWDGKSVNGSVNFSSSRVVATVTDVSSNQQSSSPITINIDSIIPSFLASMVIDVTQLSLNLSHEANITFGPSEAVTYEVNISNGVQERLITGDANSSSNTTVTWNGTLANGTWFDDGNASVTVNITDWAGNFNSSGPVNITVDSNAPNITTAFNATSDIISGALATELNFTFTAIDVLPFNYTILVNDSSSYWNTTGAATNNTQMNITWNGTDVNGSLMQEAAVVVTLTLTDEVGNTVTDTLNNTVDNTAPSLNFTYPANASFAPLGNLSVFLDVYDLHVDSVQLNVSNSTWSTTVDMSNGTKLNTTNYSNYTGIIDGTELANDTYLVSCLVNDTAGNLDNTTNITIYSDRFAPEISWTSPPNNSQFPPGTLLKPAITEWIGIDTVWYSLNGSANTTILSPYQYDTTGISNGIANFTIYANDTLGLTNSSMLNFSIDNTPLSLNVTAPTNLSSYSGAAARRLDWNETGVTLTYEVDGLVDTTWFGLDGLTNTTITDNSTMNITRPGGLHRVTVYANDTGANLLSSERWVFTDATVNVTDWLLNATTNATLNVTFANETDLPDYDNLTLLDTRVNIVANTTNVWLNITNLLASNASWANTLTIYNETSDVTDALTGIVTAVVDMVWVDQFEEFEPFYDDYNATIFLPVVYDSLFYCHGSLESPTCDPIITACEGYTGSPCYNTTVDNKTKIFLPHLSGIVGANDTTPPANQSLSINSGGASTTSPNVNLDMTAVGAVYCQYSNDNTTWSAWYDYGDTVAWTLSSSYGTKTVYGRCKDMPNNTAAPVNDTISYAAAPAAPTGGARDDDTGGGGGGGGGGGIVKVEPVIANFTEDEYSESSILEELEDPLVQQALGERVGADLVDSSSQARQVADVTRAFDYSTEYIFFTTNTSLTLSVDFSEPVLDLVLVDEVPKEFSEIASDLIIDVYPPADVTILKDDPIVSFEFGDVSGKVSINYTVQKEMLLAVMDRLITELDNPKLFAAAPPVVVPEPTSTPNVTATPTPVATPEPTATPTPTPEIADITSIPIVEGVSVLLLVAVLVGVFLVLRGHITIGPLGKPPKPVATKKPAPKAGVSALKAATPKKALRETPRKIVKPTDMLKPKEETKPLPKKPTEASRGAAATEPAAPKKALSAETAGQLAAFDGMLDTFHRDISLAKKKGSNVKLLENELEALAGDRQSLVNALEKNDVAYIRVVLRDVDALSKKVSKVAPGGKPADKVPLVPKTEVSAPKAATPQPAAKVATHKAVKAAPKKPVRRPPSEFTPETKRRLKLFEENLKAAKDAMASLTGKNRSAMAKLIEGQEANMSVLDDAVRTDDKSKIGEADFQLLFKKDEIKKLLK
ncbi:S8 family serine peptidase [archaeon]